MSMRSYFLFVVGLFQMSHIGWAQYDIEVTEAFGNNFKGGKPGEIVYLVLGFPEAYADYFFTDQDAKLWIHSSKGDEELSVSKSDMFFNKRSGLLEYYHRLGAYNKLNQLKPMDLYLASADEQNVSKTEVTEKDLQKLVNEFTPPPPGSSGRAKMKFYRKTGISQGQLYGATTNFVITKRKSCSAKKRAFRRQGIMN